MRSDVWAGEVTAGSHWHAGLRLQRKAPASPRPSSPAESFPVGTRAEFETTTMNITNLRNSAAPAAPADGNVAATPDAGAAREGQHDAPVHRGALQELATHRGPRALNLTGDSVRLIGGFATSRDLLSLATSDRGIGALSASLLPRERVMVAAEEATTLAAFLGALVPPQGATATAAITVRGLPPAQRSGPLSALARRIPALPVASRLEATVAFRAAFGELDEGHRTPELVGLHTATNPAPGSETRAVTTGEHVGHIAALHGIAGQGDIARLESVAITSRRPNSAGGAVRAGMYADEIAQQYGITTDRGISQLQAAVNTARAVNRIESGADCH